MSQYQTSLGETISGIPYPQHGLLGSLQDPHFQPGLSQEIELDEDDLSPLSPTYGLVRTRYGPYIQYLPTSTRVHPKQSSESTQHKISVSNDFSIFVGYTRERISILCNMNTYTNPYSAVNAGYCYTCDQRYSQMRRGLACDHFYALSGFNTDANDHYGPFVAATTLRALVHATCIAEGLEEGLDKGISSTTKDAWMAGCWDNPSNYSMNDEQVDTRLLESFVEDIGDIIACFVLPLHWSGYAFHQMIQVITSTGYIASLCSLSLRIIQQQHIGFQCRVLDKRNIEYDLKPSSIKAAMQTQDGAGGSVLVLDGQVEGKETVWSFNIGDIVQDVTIRCASPASSGKGVWTAVELPRYPCVGIQVPGEEREPILVRPRREVGLAPVSLTVPVSDCWVLGGSELSLVQTSVRRDGPPLLKEAFHAVSSYVLSFMRAPASDLTYHPPFRGLMIDSQDSIHAKRTFLDLIPCLQGTATSTSKGQWCNFALQQLQRLYQCHSHNAILRGDSLDASQPQLPHHQPTRTEPQSNGRFIVTLDSLGRVSVYDVVLQCVIFQRGGFRNGKAIWVNAVPLSATCSTEEAMVPHIEDVLQSSIENTHQYANSVFKPQKHSLQFIYTLTRGVAEVWSVDTIPRMLASMQQSDATILDTGGQQVSQHVPLDTDIQQILWKRQSERIQPLQQKQEDINSRKTATHPLESSPSVEAEEDEEFHDVPEQKDNVTNSNSHVLYSLLGLSIVKADGSIHSLLLTLPQE